MTLAVGRLKRTLRRRTVLGDMIATLRLGWDMWVWVWYGAEG